jgi:hypothetical protein
MILALPLIDSHDNNDGVLMHIPIFFSLHYKAYTRVLILDDGDGDLYL